MDAAAPISPELVLVYPEMREQAIGMLPDLAWQTFVARARVLAQAPAEESASAKLSPREVVALTPALLSLGTWMVIAFAGATLLTLALTLYADAVR
jgi:hypothetical protein